MPERLIDGEFDARRKSLVPSNRRPPAYLPEVQVGPFCRVAVFPLPETSLAVAPRPSSKGQPATSPGGTGGVELETVTVTGLDVPRLPAASRARACRVCWPFGADAVFQVIEYGAVVSSAPRGAPSSRNCTPATPTLSLALAETATFPETMVPGAGAVRDALGGEVSLGSALKATMCITHRLPFWVAVALCGPAEVTFLSSVRVPLAFKRLVKPVPAAVTLLLEEPAPKIRSSALVVVDEPLFIALVVPMLTALASSGAVRLSPEYSWMKSFPNDVMEVPNVAVTVLAPPAIFLA